jgi:myosin heavy subunit
MTAKEYFINRDELLSILDDSYLLIYSNNPAIVGNISTLKFRLASDSVIFNKTIEKAKDLFSRLRSDMVEMRKTREETIYSRDFISAVNELLQICNSENPRQYMDQNSESYFSKRINEWKEKEKNLKKEIQTLKESNEKYEEKEEELKEIKDKINKIQAEKDELLKKLDAQQNLESKISKAFAELKKHISPLKKEKTRLNWMFGIYAFLCVVVLVILIYFELSYLSKWTKPESWIDYLPFYIPVPIVGGLLWAFIFQMNRAQRQLMQIANVLYHIDYVEGLLLAINLVNSDIYSASEKISNVLDDMIKSYISFPDSLSQQVLDKELSKDNIDLHTFINLAKEIKDALK